VGIILTNCLLLLVDASRLLAMALYIDPKALVGVAITGGLSLLFALLLARLKITARFNEVANLAIAFSFVAVHGSILVTGGLFASPATTVLMVPALMAFCLMGHRTGWGWALATLLALTVQTTIQLSPVTLPNVVVKSQAQQIHAASFFIAFIAITGIIAIYDNMNQRLKRERDQQREEYAYLATRDALTGLANRHLFDLQLQAAIERSQRHESQVALLYLDLDGFKPINDRWGHEAGDHLLKEVALRLKELLRQSDTIARIGGDEFAMILEDIDDEDSIAGIASKILEHIALPVHLGNATATVTGSVGVAIYPTCGPDTKSLRNCADQAMYEAKKQRNQWRLFQEREQDPLRIH